MAEAISGEHSRRRYLRVWETHFAKVEHSELLQQQEVVNYALESQPTTIKAGFDLAEVPTLDEFERSIRQLSWRKAPGFDGLGAEVWQGHVASNRKGLFALFLKTAARQYLPIQFRGGFLVPLFKNRGSTADPANFRGILLQNTGAKIFAKTWRRPLARCLQRTAAPLHLGCRCGIGVSGAHLPLRLHVDSCAKSGQSMAVIFIDLKAAYYSVVKELYAADPGVSDATFLEGLFSKLGLPEGALKDFVDYVGSTCLLDDAGVSGLLRAIVKSTLDRSWYQIPSSPDVFAPSTGTRPGDPLADILFSFTMADVLWEVYQQLWEHEDILQVAPGFPCGSTCADDTCIYLGGEASTLEQRVGVAFSIVQEAFTKRGLFLAYGPFKTAVILAFRGSAGKPRHKAVFTKQEPSITCCLEFGPPVEVGAFFTYKHLGSVVDASGSLLPEIRARGSKALHAVKPLASSCLSRQDLPLARRRRILQTLGLSVLVHNSGTWRRLSKGEARVWSSYVWRLYGCLLPKSFAENFPHVSLEQAALTAGGFMPEALLHASRLRLLAQLLRQPDDSLIVAIEDNHLQCGDTSWWTCVQEAISWLAAVAGESDTLSRLLALTSPGALAFPEPSLASGIKSMLKRAQKMNEQYLQQWADLKWADEMMRQSLSSANWKIPAIDEEPERRVACPECSKWFADHASLATHRFKSHQVHVAARRFADTSLCGACGKDFNTRPRLIKHLQYSSRRCLPWLLMHASPVDEVDSARLDEAAAAALLVERRSGIRSAATRLPVDTSMSRRVPSTVIEPLEITTVPVLQGYGPLQEEQLKFLETWRQARDVWPLLVEIWTEFAADLASVMLACPMSCHQTFAGNVIELVDEAIWRQDDFEVVIVVQEKLTALIHAVAPNPQDVRHPFRSRDERLQEWERRFGSLPVWMGLRASSSRPRIDGEDKASFPLRLAAQEHQWQSEVHQWLPGPAIPRAAFPTEVFYLILFSGHRRCDDIASQIWRQDFGARTCWPICLDLCIDQSGGNLMDPEVLSFWRARILANQVVGLHASPPCETYTEARYLPPPEGSSRPRPLRTWSFPWGLPGLDAREVRQLSVGNSLYFVAIVMATWMVASGGCATVEHPKGFGQAEGRFTIWLSSFLKRLCNSSECSVLAFNQGFLGQVSLKPTRFLLVRLPMLPRILRQLSTFSGPFETLSGQGENGEWRTSKAKAFPPALCRTIALAVAVFCQSRLGCTEGKDLPWPDLPECAWQPFDPYMVEFEGTTMGPDFWG